MSKAKGLQFAPFTPEQVQSLEWRQMDENPHKCSCGKVLVASEEGLKCECGVIQTWACPKDLEYTEAPQIHTETFDKLCFYAMLGKEVERQIKPYIVNMLEGWGVQSLKTLAPEAYDLYMRVMKEGIVVHNGRTYRREGYLTPNEELLVGECTSRDGDARCGKVSG